MRSQTYDPRPFSKDQKVEIVLPAPEPNRPEDQQAVEQLRRLIEREIHEFEVELGAPVSMSPGATSTGPRFLIGPASMNPAFASAGLEGSPEPVVRRDLDRQLLIADAPTLSGVVDAISMLRTLTASGAAEVTATHCKDLNDCIERVQQEIAWTYPAFQLREIDWQSVCERHSDAVRETTDPFRALQRWVAVLQDMHTWVQPDPSHGLLPYTVQVEPDQARFVHVPDGTPAHHAGVRRGDVLLDVDSADALERAGAPAHMRPFLAGRRLLSGPANEPREFRVARGSGDALTFIDTPSYRPHSTSITWFRLPSETGYLKLLGYPPGTSEAIDTALAELRSSPALIVDLRGNAGGMLIEALDFRDRFIDRPMSMGTVRYSSPAGGLSEAFPIHAEPAPPERRWTKPVRFLIDPMTASASEDALLGLQGLPQVKLVGSRTAGGSGRPRSFRLLPGTRLSVSTALTFDRDGRCIEGNGLAADINAPVMLDGDELDAIQRADRSW